MARKGSQPALYELIRPGDQARPVSSSAGAPPSTQARFESRPLPVPREAGEPLAETQPGPPARTVRVPVGTLYLLAAGALVALVLAYLYGVSVGERVQRERLAQQRAEEMDAAANLPKVDPLSAGRVPSSLSGGGTGDLTGDQRGDAPGVGSLGPASGGDPRQSGLNYFILAHTATRNGEAMVDFCRKNGLDAHLVPDDNDRLRLVIVLPGFAAGERNSAAVRALESQIRSVGLKWKGAARGNRDFGDAYPAKFSR